MRYIIIGLVALLGACQTDLPQEEGHAHDAAGNHIAPGREVPRKDYTIWTDKTELFVEFPVFVVGMQSRFAAHFTAMEGHKAVEDGQVTASLIVGTEGIRQQVDAPSSPGIFAPTLAPVKAGEGQLIFDIKTPTFQDKIVIEGVRVFPSIDAAIAAQMDVEENDGISFLKEQAWKMAFQTEVVKQKEVYESIATSGRWTSTPSDYNMVTASATGKLILTKKDVVVGQKVRKGEILGRINSDNLVTNNLSAELAKAKEVYEQLAITYERKKELFDNRLLTQTAFEEIERAYNGAKREYDMLAAGYSAKGYTAVSQQIVAPSTGYLRAINVANGAFVTEGEELFVVVDSETSVLDVQIASTHASQLNTIREVWYENPQGHWQKVLGKGGEILTVDRRVSIQQPMLSALVKVNEVVDMPEGSFVAVNISVGSGQKGVVVPASALLEDYGHYSVIVQLSGETFEKRHIVIGKQNGEYVEVVEGLSVGEMVVTTGAYQVKMAAMSGQAPAHGHAH